MLRRLRQCAARANKRKEHIVLKTSVDTYTRTSVVQQFPRKCERQRRKQVPYVGHLSNVQSHNRHVV